MTAVDPYPVYYNMMMMDDGIMANERGLGAPPPTTTTPASRTTDGMKEAATVRTRFPETWLWQSSVQTLAI